MLWRNYNLLEPQIIKNDNKNLIIYILQREKGVHIMSLNNKKKNYSVKVIECKEYKNVNRFLYTKFSPFIYASHSYCVPWNVWLLYSMHWSCLKSTSGSGQICYLRKKNWNLNNF